MGRENFSRSIGSSFAEAGRETKSAKMYRVPSRGENVRLGGLRSHPHLNGALAEIVGDGPGADGFLNLRVWEGGREAHHQGRGWCKLKAHPRVLQPLRSSSTPALGGRLVQGPSDDEASVVSLATFSAPRAPIL